MHQLVLETTAPFQGLPELVAYDEGLFEQEGLRVSWVDRNVGVATQVDRTITSHTQVNPFTSHGKLFEQGLAEALITAPATLCPLSLSHGSPRRPEGGRWYLHGCQDGSKH